MPFMLGYVITSINQLKWHITCALIVFIYLLIILLYAENIPYTDDLAVLSSLYDFNHETDWLLKVKTLFSFHNEHRIAVPRLITMLLYYIQGKHINIIWWILIGNLSLFLPVYLYFKTAFVDISIVYFIPVLLLILQPMHYELIYWGMASVQNIGVLLLTTLSFYYLVYRNNIVWAIGIGVLAVFTSANGIFVFIIGTVLILYKRDWYKGIPWAIAGAVSAFLYWQGFSITENSGKGSETSLQFTAFLKTFLSLSGGLVYTQSLPVLSLALGVLLLITLLYLAYYRLIVCPIMSNKSQQFLLCCLAFILSTIAAISLGRDLESILLISRYKLYSALLIALTYILLLDWIKNRQFIIKLVLLFGLLFWSSCYIRYTSQFESHSRLLFSHFFNWKYGNMLDISPPFAEKYYADHWHKVYQSGEYVPPKRVLEKSQKIILEMNKEKTPTPYYSVSDYTVTIKPVNLPIGEYYLLCRNNQRTAIYPLNMISFYRTLFLPDSAYYSTSINYSYWLKSPAISLFVMSDNEK